ncbi:MAG: addiction module toxin, HicA family [Bacteroidetes bacterium]|nr:addiction module toxin, HicA family [Bacteroidota bacterium]
MKRGDFLKHLNTNGCTLLREVAKHTIYLNPENQKQSTVGRHQELSNLLCKKSASSLTFLQFDQLQANQYQWKPLN